jgi:hypothetical protein
VTHAGDTKLNESQRYKGGYFNCNNYFNDTFNYAILLPNVIESYLETHQVEYPVARDMRDPNMISHYEYHDSTIYRNYPPRLNFKQNTHDYSRFPAYLYYIKFCPREGELAAVNNRININQCGSTLKGQSASYQVSEETFPPQTEGLLNKGYSVRHDILANRFGKSGWICYICKNFNFLGKAVIKEERSAIYAQRCWS